MGDEQLIPCDFGRDFVKINLARKCAIYKPIKLHQVSDKIHYHILQKDGFCRLAYAYNLKDKYFDFFGLHLVVQNRFIELLAPLTLFHFSKVSKPSYYECLNLRGIEFCYMDTMGIGINGFEGRLIGLAKQECFYPYIIYYGHLTMSILQFVRVPELFKTPKRFKLRSISFTFYGHAFDTHMAELCTVLITPEVEHVYVSLAEWYYNDLGEHSKDETQFSIQKFTQFLDFCTNVKTLDLHHSQLPFDRPLFAADFADVVKMIEKWSFKAVNLEIFIISGWILYYQLHNHQMKSVILRDDQWLLSDKLVGNFSGDGFEIISSYSDKCGYTRDNHRFSHDIDYHVEQILAKTKGEHFGPVFNM